MALKKISSREKIILAVTLCLAGGAVFYSLVLEPALGQWTLLHRQIVVRANELKNARKLLRQYPDIQNQYESLQKLAKSSGKYE